MPQSESTVVKLYVSNLPYSWNEADLRHLFQQVGKVTEHRVIRDRDSKKSLGYGFVTVDTFPHAAGHWRQLQGAEVDGLDGNGKPTRRTLTVDIARGQRQGAASADDE